MAKDDHGSVECVDPTRGLVRHERRVAVRPRFREAEDPIGGDESCLPPVCLVSNMVGRVDCWLKAQRTFRTQTLDQLAQDAAFDALGVRERDQDVDVVRFLLAAAVAVAPSPVKTPEPAQRREREVWKSAISREGRTYTPQRSENEPRWILLSWILTNL